MKRYIRASIDPSAPDWLRKALAGKFGESLVRRAQIALDKADFSQEPAENSLPIYLLETDYGNAVYAPGINDDDESSINGRWRKLKSIAKSKLPQMAVDTVYIDLDNPANKFNKRAKYQDPRYEYRYSDKGRYAGQYREREYLGHGKYGDFGEWSQYGRTPSNERMHRDKSGYKIPRPEDMIARFYSRFPERVTEKVNKVYAKLLDAQRDLMSSSFNNVGQEWGDSNIRNAYSRFGDAVSAYKQLLYIVQNQKDSSGGLTNRWGRGEGYSEFSNQIKSINSDLEDVREFLGLASK